MPEYASIADFNQGWIFFTKKIKYGQYLVDEQVTLFDEEYYGKFPCSDFSCLGCDDWLDADNQNRNVDKLKTHQLIQKVLNIVVGNEAD